MEHGAEGMRQSAKGMTNISEFDSAELVAGRIPNSAICHLFSDICHLSSVF
jgi:hypothetical protein